ncbi:12982_t:CDS:2 [Acaulospora morrowiae]|uniref:12982_t:CDS:1 n=1 Tax=Acaulospora morrowiae TaxID=94023 RepID=A0A9N9G1W0_9GLOM|nr:12982_t:CDS:2 [Acaulospora morrowiae]
MSHTSSRLMDSRQKKKERKSGSLLDQVRKKNSEMSRYTVLHKKRSKIVQDQRPILSSIRTGKGLSANYSEMIESVKRSWRKRCPKGLTTSI